MPALKDLLEGKPLRSPLHPSLVHLPVALFPLSVLLDIASWIFADPTLYLVRGAFLTLTIGLVTAVFAAVFGIVDYTEIRSDHPAKKTATLHMVLNLVAVGLFALGAGLRYGNLDASHTAAFPLITSLVGLAILGYSGYLGGHLVYSDGVAVGRHRRDTRLPENTVTVSAAGAASVVVPGAAELRPGETLRAEVDGTVMTIARTASQTCAFQEFCTHRFGPLSEGRIEGNEMVCPWHRSRFDMRSGKVTQGPANVDLRTFAIETRGGRVAVERPTKSA
ncbi:DUF2231 domain-containing protein [Opitutus terrae]|uniref:Rieske (2Fe-2S) domain protein n=1 Tax=Opitutus terrae (strain DSM 11246 / JCM 15787 / PB90-1) TaxID=452637 RepID=B1ZMG3_OPITP|nr:DUF2231 domain-containing protein [Opitutus terrae]ACB73416.1 Rieske (2Fe-2S) domain protein [Opitutus terrae PB90-1]